MYDDQPGRSGFKGSSELRGRDFTGQDRAHALTKGFGRPTRRHVLRQDYDRISSKAFFSNLAVEKCFSGLGRGFHQQDIRFQIVERLGKRLEIRGGPHDVDAAVRKKVPQTGANQR
jgi:hypothetical protein